MTDEETRAELRIIEKDLARQEQLALLKAKHLIVGTPEEQKVLVVEKRTEVDNRIIEARDEIQNP